MITTTLDNEKLFFKYLLKNNYFENDSNIFSNSVIKSAYEFVKTFFDEYNSIPTVSVIHEATSIKKESLNYLMNIDDINNVDIKWLETIFTDYLKKRKIDIQLLEFIEDSRNGNYDKIIPKLNISLDISDSNIDIYEEEKLKTIPDSIYEKLPDILQDLVKNFTGQEKDVLLTSILSCISIYFSNVKGYYWKGTETYNNIYTFIVGESGIGKSIMKKAKILTKELNSWGYNKFQEEKANYNKLSKDDKNNLNPPIEHLFVSGADATQQGILKYLKNNNGMFLIFATEAEALTSKVKDVNGDYTLIIRESIQNDDLSKILKTEDSVLINKPKLNICVSGTQDQIDKIIGKDGEDNGTFNRFLYYYWVNNDPKVENPFTEKNSNELFYETSKNLFELYDQYFRFPDKYMFELTDNQVDMFYKRMQKSFDYILGYYENSAQPIIKRHYLYAYKLMITIACLRIYDKKYNNIFGVFDLPDKITITDEDLENVLELVGVYLHHSLTLLNKFKSKPEINLFESPWKMVLWNKIPDLFNRQLIINEGIKLKKSGKTIDKLICEWKKLNKITKEGYSYKKNNEL